MSMVQESGCRPIQPNNARIEEHPCYSEGASHRYARMHLPVAPACNMQCRYCNRKFDCSNESRPGVVSGVLNPDQAVKRAWEARQRLPHLRVIGFAGPGDPLANRERVFATCKPLRSSFPDWHLCLSTNGLCLPESVNAILDHGIQHVTITLNALDPEVGAAIYSWIFWNKKRRRGVEAAHILLEQQLAGLSALIARGVLVKINSVLIPGVNDRQIPEINRLVSEAGVFSHNIMPLISAPEHGTYYGVMGIPGPNEAQLQQVRSQCGGAAKLMTHCRQCRADAVGLLEQDRQAELNRSPVEDSRVIPIHRPTRRDPVANPPSPVVLAVASQSGERVDTHFGHAAFFRIYRVTGAQIEHLGERFVPRYCQGDDQCEDKDHTLKAVLNLLNDCQGVICARIGFVPWQELLERGIEPVNSHADRPVLEALSHTARLLQDKHAIPTPKVAAAGMKGRG
ncbi:MAG: nitrogenase cofactor biosynthesis protein NifB [Magnetococcales bacterium]|nr:nitrogenase cofactor biosynthesis protein NifB [Magnetococcales bacterium]